VTVGSGEGLRTSERSSLGQNPHGASRLTPRAEPSTAILEWDDLETLRPMMNAAQEATLYKRFPLPLHLPSSRTRV
jgi:hypothetical protein